MKHNKVLTKNLCILYENLLRKLNFLNNTSVTKSVLYFISITQFLFFYQSFFNYVSLIRRFFCLVAIKRFVDIKLFKIGDLFSLSLIIMNVNQTRDFLSKYLWVPFIRPWRLLIWYLSYPYNPCNLQKINVLYN